MRCQRHAPAALHPGKILVAIVQEAGWESGPVWTGAENLAPTGIRSPDRPVLSQSLYRLHYLAHSLTRRSTLNNLCQNMKPALLVSDELLDVNHPKYLNYFQILWPIMHLFLIGLQNIWQQIKNIFLNILSYPTF